MAASQIIVATLLALLTGLVFNKIQPTIETGVQNRLGVIFFIIINQIYSTATALEPLVQERALFIHVKIFPREKMILIILFYLKENASGYYRVSTFFIAKLICDLLPMRLIPSIIYSIITYFMVRFSIINRSIFYLFFNDFFKYSIWFSYLFFCCFIYSNIW